MNDNIKAFPLPLGDRSVAAVLSPGMDLRDYFAAHIMQGMLACNGLTSEGDVLACDAYIIADAMMEARGHD